MYCVAGQSGPVGRKHLKIRKRIEMTIETEKIVTFHMGGGMHREFCQLCLAFARMLTVTEATHLTGMSSRNIFQLIEAGGVHFRETATGGLLVCGGSLSAEKTK